MAAQKITVRSKITGDLAEIDERSWPLFAGFYDRVDTPDPAAVPSPPESPATETPAPRARAPRGREPQGVTHG